MGRTPLHIAAGAGNSDAIFILVQCNGIEIEYMSLGNETPLMKAV